MKRLSLCSKISLLVLSGTLLLAPSAPAADTKPADQKAEAASPAQEILERFGLVRKPSPYQRDTGVMKASFTSVVAGAKLSTVRVLSEGKQVALGAVVDARGYVATKASELKQPLECEFADGHKSPAKLVGVQKEYDLALLQVPAEKLTPITWRDAAPPAVGSWLATVGLSNEPVAIGVVSVAARTIDGFNGVLGIVLDQTDAGPVIKDVLPNSGASKAGLQLNDVITRINGEEVKTRMALSKLIRLHQPGEVLELQVKRGEKQFDLKATVGKPPGDPRTDRRDSLNTMGGPLSTRRNGFPLALQHDTVLRPNECGGPVVDLSGKVVGLNIARAGRVESYAVPREAIQKLLPDLIAGKYPPPAPETAAIATAAAKPAGEAKTASEEKPAEEAKPKP